MEVQEIKLNQLLDWVQSDAYRQSAVLPISPQRAYSHTKNPRALPDDVVLVLVYENQVMVGYLGVLPDEIYIQKTNNMARIGWLSCMWVNPNLRGKGIAKMLINTVFKAWDYRILVTEFTPAAKGLYDSTQQFFDLAKPQGIRCYLRSNLAYLLPHRNEKYTNFKGLLSVADGVLNLANSIRLLFKTTPQAPTFSYCNYIDNSTWAFIQTHKNQELMNRQQADLNWLLGNVWLLSAGVKDSIAERYHFSSVDANFNFLGVQLWENNVLIGFMVLSIRNRNLKIPYCYFDAQYTAQMADFIQYYMLRSGLDMLTIFEPRLVEYLHKNTSLFYKKRTFQRHYICTKVYQQAIENQQINIQDGDADAAFT